jgi:hypothetical protein
MKDSLKSKKETREEIEARRPDIRVALEDDIEVIEVSESEEEEEEDYVDVTDTKSEEKDD